VVIIFSSTHYFNNWNQKAIARLGFKRSPHDYGGRTMSPSVVMIMGVVTVFSDAAIDGEQTEIEKNSIKKTGAILLQNRVWLHCCSFLTVLRLDIYLLNWRLLCGDRHFCFGDLCRLS
jgi:hypothetical protein